MPIPMNTGTAGAVVSGANHAMAMVGAGAIGTTHVTFTAGAAGIGATLRIDMAGAAGIVPRAGDLRGDLIRHRVPITTPTLPDIIPVPDVTTALRRNISTIRSPRHLSILLLRVRTASPKHLFS